MNSQKPWRSSNEQEKYVYANGDDDDRRTGSDDNDVADDSGEAGGPDGWNGQVDFAALKARSGPQT